MQEAQIIDHRQLPHAGDINRPYRGSAEDIDRKKKRLAAQVDQKLLLVDMLVHVIIQARLKGDRIDQSALDDHERRPPDRLKCGSLKHLEFDSRRQDC